MKIGDNIKRLRKRLGLSQEELAKKVGYTSKSTINKIELGINDIPQSKIVVFAEVLGVSPSVLMGWEEQERTNDAIADIVVKLRTDTEFLETVELIYNLDDDKLNLVKQMLLALK